MLIVRILVALAGAALVVSTAQQAILTFVVPRAVSAPLSRVVFVLMRRLFNRIVEIRGAAADRERRHEIMAHWAPIALVALPVVWLTIALVGYAGIFWGVEHRGVESAFTVSGSSLFTLGFAAPGGFGSDLISFSEAAVGVSLLALVIAYLPTIYGAYSRRELIVSMLDARAGSPPSPLKLMALHYRYGGLPRLDQRWSEWEQWIVDVGETHMTHPVLPFFRSARPNHSWVTAAAVLLDSANLRLSAVVLAGDGNADAAMYLNAGTRVLRDIAGFFQLPVDHDGDHRLGEAELNVGLDELAAAGLPIDEDRQAVWERFSARRAGYEPAVLGLASLVDAASAAWSTDRSAPVRLPPIFRRRSTRSRRRGE